MMTESMKLEGRYAWDNRTRNPKESIKWGGEGKELRTR